MNTYRERREAKAERYREWADKREAKSEQALASVNAITERIPFGQPILVGHHSERGARADQRRIESGMDRFVEHRHTAERMREKADNIERAAKRAIYSDDDDAAGSLRERIAKLEAQRGEIKARNAAFRKEHCAELKAMTPYERNQAVPYPAYVLTNLSANINRNKKRLAEVEAQAEAVESGDRGPGKQMTARYAGECADCGNAVDRGEPMTYHRRTREVVCANCETV